MMKKLKITVAILTAAVMSATVTTISYADSIYDTAEYIELGEKASTYIAEYLDDGDTVDYMIEVNKGGLLKLYFKTETDILSITVYDYDGNRMEIKDYSIKSGDTYRSGTGSYTIGISWNNVVERMESSIYYEVPAGEYYIRLRSVSGTGIGTWSGDGGAIEMTATMTPVKGDVDESGAVNALDASHILRNIVNGKVMDSYVADFNEDGYINAMDASAILKYVVGY